MASEQCWKSFCGITGCPYYHSKRKIEEARLCAAITAQRPKMCSEGDMDWMSLEELDEKERKRKEDEMYKNNKNYNVPINALINIEDMSPETASWISRKTANDDRQTGDDKNTDEVVRSRPIRTRKPTWKKAEEEKYTTDTSMKKAEDKQKTSKKNTTKKIVKENTEKEVDDDPNCRGCDKNVELGVFCEEGRRWWHYECINISETAVCKQGTFSCHLCNKHRSDYVSNQQASHDMSYEALVKPDDKKKSELSDEKDKLKTNVGRTSTARGTCDSELETDRMSDSELEIGRRNK